MPLSLRALAFTLALAVPVFAPAAAQAPETAFPWDLAPAAKSAVPSDTRSKLRPVSKPAKVVRPEPARDADIALVRGGARGCEPQCPEWITISGRIDSASAARFKRVLARLGTRRVPVLIDSPGGSVEEALAIGRLIRARGLEVGVARTRLDRCAAKDTACRADQAQGIVRGNLEGGIARCASACAFLIAGGTRRYVGTGAQVGLHDVATYQVWYRVERKYDPPSGLGGPDSKRLVGQRRVAERAVRMRTSERVYEMIRAYYAEMGVGDRALLAIVKATPHDGIHWLTRAELSATALVTHAIESRDLVAGRTASAEPLVPLVPPAPRAR